MTLHPLRTPTRSSLGRVSRAGAWVSIVAAAFLACFGFGCERTKPKKDTAPAARESSSKLEKKAKKLGPKVTKRLSQISSLAKKAGSEPPVEANEPLKKKLETGTWVILGDAWLKDPHHVAAADELSFDTGPVSLCAFAVEENEDEADEDEDEEDQEPDAVDDLDVELLQECAALEYVAVIRTHDLDRPEVHADRGTFERGEFRGDLLVFHLKSGEVRGRYKIAVTNDAELTQDGKSSRDDAWIGLAMANLKGNVERAAEEKLD
jgi:hypothetical protein